MTTPNQAPDSVDATPEKPEEEVQTAFQVMDGEWEYNPLTCQVMMSHGHREYPIWVQARSKAELDEINSRVPDVYNNQYYVAVRNNPFGIKTGIVLRIIHRGTNAPHVDRNWIKAVAYADPEQNHEQVFPELELHSPTVNDVIEEIRANDGKMASRNFSQDYFG